MPRCRCAGAICFWSGLPGAGKSTLGRQLARRLHKRFVDADTELEQRLGVSIPTIFEIEGEAGFRDREESDARRSHGARRHRALHRRRGGAAPEQPRAAEGRTEPSSTFTPSPRRCGRRVRHSRNRPLLQTADPLARLAELYAQRDALYRETATYVVESERGEVMRLVRGFDAWPGRLMTIVSDRTLEVALGARSYPIHIGRGRHVARGRVC